MKTNFLILFLFCQFQVLTQTVDTLSARQLYAKADILQKSNQDDALATIQMGIDKAIRLKDSSGIGLGYNEKGTLLTNMGNFEEAKLNLYAALNLQKELKDTCRMASIYNNIVFLNIQKGERGTAFKNLEEAFRLLELGCSSKQILGEAFIHKGIILSQLIKNLDLY